MLIFLPYMKHYSKTSYRFYQLLIKIKLKCLGIIYKKWQIISTKYKLSEYNIWWNCLEFIVKIDPTIQMRIFNKVEHHNAICLKFGDRFFTFLAMLGLEAKAIICL